MRHARVYFDDRPGARHRGIAAIAAALLVVGLGVTSSSAATAELATAELSAVEATATEPAAEATPSSDATTADESAPAVDPAATAEPVPEVEPTAAATDAARGATPSAAPEAVAAPEPSSTDGAGALAVSPMAVVGAPDGATAPYVHWTAVDTAGNPVAGATFDFQRANGNSYAATSPIAVSDCVSGACAVADRDNDPGEYLVKWIAPTPGVTPPASTTTVTAGGRHRVRPAVAPAGYEWVSSPDWVDSSTLTWSGTGSDSTLDMGTFVLRQTSNRPFCEAGYVYSVTDNGQLQQVAPGGVVTPKGTRAPNVSSFNGLGIGSGGQPVYAIARSGSGTSMSGTIYSYNVTTGVWSSTGATSGNTSSNLVGGAVDLSSGLYYFGGFTSSGSFRLYQYDPAANPAVTLKGTVSTGSGGNANGDFAFDATGNLFIVRGDGTSTTVYSVTSANLAAASGGAIASSVSRSFTTMSNVNGIAFDASGKAFLASTTTMRSYDMPGWTQNPTTDVTTGLGDSTDLSTCSSPPTITIEKFVEGRRVNATDQFTLTLTQGAAQIGTVTTSGNASGLQGQRIGPLPTVRNVALTFGETASGTTNLNQYVSSYRCLVDGVQRSQGNGTTGSITIPTGGQSVECRIYNSPVAAQVSITKLVTDGAGANPAPRPGWNVTSSVAATTGTIVAGTQAATQQTATSGTATWDYTFGSTTSRATVTVSETMQPGYVFQSAQCVVTHLDGTTATTTLTGPGAQGITGVAPGDRVDCTYVNRPAPGQLAVTKILDASVPAGSGAIPFAGTYTCVLGGATVASGTWTVTGAGAAVLTPAATSVAAGASCTVTETPPTASQGLPNSSYVWGAPQVGPAVTIASGTTSSISVTNSATRVRGAFQVTKVVPAGSTVDAGSTFSGQWRCTLGAEVVTGTWGPIAAGATWVSPSTAQIPTGAECAVTTETRAAAPVAADLSYRWAGDPAFSAPVQATTGTTLATVTVTNATARDLGAVVWSKVDGAGAALASSEWLLTGPGLPAAGLAVTDCVATAPTDCTGPDRDPAPGAFQLVDLLWGDYELVETRAPAGYQLGTTVHEFTIGPALTVDLGPIVNDQRGQPSLPLTGGLGSDSFAVGGGALLAAAAAVLLLFRRRRARP
ncbi:hypothetical protein C8046_10060 [Serinibacter arcticus]|uniref:Gram-positive cocci surface proteins LPxTG domain-containing protein n=1 Tax=Serinibacter arcticus TaxID=1655435 RepID=A0A2U1ZVD4_9MICO|nr:DUF5979 domain-containing protein [Serinibacter arcticus]PWD50946.1 hypothetical protein C8046_10060 [Serinibacter arcticus]